MYPILQPGSLVVIDQSRNKVSSDGWTDEHDRPIYFLEHRRGYLCGWCALTEGRLVVQSTRLPNSPAGFRALGNRRSGTGNRPGYCSGVEKAPLCSYFSSSTKVSKSVR